jgi:hypothetical protein
MQMLSSVTDTRYWLSRFRPRPVVLSAPYPADECLRRLTMVTTHRGAASWYLDPRTAGHPTPRLRGDVDPSRISVARWEDTNGRNSFTPWLDVRLEPTARGGTTLTGTIGLRPEVQGLMPVITGVGGLIATAVIAAGAVQLVHGNVSALPLMLGPLAMIAILAVVNVAGLRSLERDIPKLIQETNSVLDSTATFTSPAL